MTYSIIIVFLILNILTLQCFSDGSFNICAKTNLKHCFCELYTNEISGFVSSTVDCSFKGFENVDFVLPLWTEELDLSFNNIRDLQNINITNPSSLKKLFLNRNEIEQISSNVFSSLENLHELDLSENRINNFENDVFYGLSKLYNLNLASNNLTSLRIFVFKDLPLLNVLILDYNNLGDFFKSTENLFSYLQINPSIEEISLKYTNITNFIDDTFFTHLENLKRVDFSDNNLEILPELPKSLEILDISSCKFRNLSQNLNLPSLTHLYMNDLQNLDRINEEDLKYLENLKVLQIKNCKRLTVLSPFLFGKLSPSFHMKEINLLGSSLNNFDESLVDLFSKIENIDLRGTPINCVCSMKWILNLNLNISRTQREFTRCKMPSHLTNLEVFSLKESDLCKDPPWDTKVVTTIAMVCLCLTLAGLALWLVLLWQPLKVISHQHVTSYHPVEIQPNNAELY